MRLNTGEARFTEAEERPRYEREAAPSQMTPARRMALEALEREFAQLLKAKTG